MAKRRDVELLGHRVAGDLAAAEGHGRDAAGGEPVGVEAAVADVPHRLQAEAADGRLGREHRRLAVGQPESFVVEPAFDFDGAANAGGAADATDRSAKGSLVSPDDLGAEPRIVAAGFSQEPHLVGDNVGGFTPFDQADVDWCRGDGRGALRHASRRFGRFGDRQSGDGDVALTPSCGLTPACCPPGRER